MRKRLHIFTSIIPRLYLDYTSPVSYFAINLRFTPKNSTRFRYSTDQHLRSTSKRFHCVQYSQQKYSNEEASSEGSASVKPPCRDAWASSRIQSAVGQTLVCSQPAGLQPGFSLQPTSRVAARLLPAVNQTELRTGFGQQSIKQCLQPVTTKLLH